MKEDEKKEETKKDPLNTALSGLGAMDPKGMPEWLMPILSSLGGMGGTYMIWVKPIQDKLEKLSEQFHTLEKQVKDLQDKNEDLEQELEELHAQSDNKLNGHDYFPVKRSTGQGAFAKRRI